MHLIKRAAIVVGALGIAIGAPVAIASAHGAGHVATTSPTLGIPRMLPAPAPSPSTAPSPAPAPTTPVTAPTPAATAPTPAPAPAPAPAIVSAPTPAPAPSSVPLTPEQPPSSRTVPPVTVDLSECVVQLPGGGTYGGTCDSGQVLAFVADGYPVTHVSEPVTTGAPTLP